MLPIVVSEMSTLVRTLFRAPFPITSKVSSLVFFYLLFVPGSFGQDHAVPATATERIEAYERVLDHPIYYPNLPIRGFVHQLVKDHEGFFWIGAEPGLARFDGKQFKEYEHDPSDTTSLSNDNVFTIRVDSIREEIWFGTMNGISVLDTKTDKFRRYLTSNSNLSDGYVRSIYNDRQGQIWVGTKHGGFLEYHQEADTFIQQFPLDSVSNLAYKYTYILDILQDRQLDSILWLGTGYGLIRWNKVTKQYTRHLYHDPNVSEKIHNLQNLYLHLYQHEDGRIYAANYRGVNIFDPQTKTIEHVDPYGGQYGDGRARYRTRKIGKFSDNTLYISLYNGLALYDLDRQQIIKTWKDESPESYYAVLTREDQGDWWGASEIGLIRYAAVRSAIKYYPVPTNGRNSAIHSMALLEARRDNTLYVGTSYGNGLLQLDLTTGHWTTFPPPAEYSENNSAFQAIEGDLTAAGDVLVAEYNHIYHFSPATQRLEKYPLQPEIENAYYRSILVDNKGHIWAGMHENGLVRIMPERDTFIIYKEELSTPDSPNHHAGIWSLFEDDAEQLWIRTNLGYSVYLPKRDTFLNFAHQDTTATAFLDPHNFAQDNSGRTWLTGREEGVGLSFPARVQSGLDTLLFTDRKDLDSFEKVGIDADGQIWISVDQRGWLLVDPASLKSRIIPAHWINGRRIKAFKALSDGKLAIGYGSGIAVFDPDDLPDIAEVPKPYLDQLLLFNQPFSLDSSLLHKQSLRLNHNQNFLTFRFGAIAYYDAGFTRLKYRLVGSHSEWFEPDQVWQASYSNLSPGHYTLEIIAENNAGVASPDPYRLSIHIVPPWWKSPWAYAGYALLLFGLFYTFYRFQLQRKLALAEAARLQEVNRFKSQMYTNITHEFRTPLTIIMGLADEVLSNGRFKLTERVRMIRKNSEQLLTLINQLLDLRKLETGNLKLHLAPGDLAKYLNYLVESFQSMAAAKHIRLIYYADPESLPVLFDEEKINLIVTNLLSNAIKFTPDYGKITVGVSREAEQTIVIKVKDTGIGIPKDEITKIFDRFHQVDATVTRKGEGTGIGLALAKELITLMEGTIEVESILGQGSTFLIRLPYQVSPEKTGKAYPVAPAPKAATTAEPFQNSNGPLILLVEDNQDVIYYLRSFLGNTYRVEKAFNGREGFEKARELIPDLIITDVMMPELDGMEMVALLKQNERTSHIPVIMLTAKVTQQDKEEGLDKGVDAYLAKPFQKEELLIRIQRLLESRRRLQEKYAGDIGLLDEKDIDDAETTFLKKLNQTIEQHIADDQFGVQDLCRAMAMSRTQLHRKITALTNQSTSEWIRQVRLHKARALLRHTDLSVGEVADRVGFKDASYFTKVFRQVFAVLPSEIKKETSRS